MSDTVQNSIEIYVALKHMGNVAKKVKEYPFVLENRPHTLRELIEESVRTCVRAYRERATQGTTPSPLTEEQLSAMREIGKFAFGVHYNTKAIEEGKAIETAIEAVQDGLVRVFCGDQERTELDLPLTVSEGDHFTFVRLTMLSGRMW